MKSDKKTKNRKKKRPKSSSVTGVPDGFVTPKDKKEFYCQAPLLFYIA